MATDLTREDFTQAEEFLVGYLSARVPNADFSPGSSVRDICVTSIAHVFAFLRKELQSVKARQSLSQIALLPPDEDVDEAVDAILSNWFVARKGALPALVSARLYFTTQASVTLRADARFFHPSGVAFAPASGETTVITGASLTPVTTLANGTLYAADVLLKATTPGTPGNILAGRFSSASFIDSAFVYAETLTDATGGTDVETTEELLARAPLAISTRNLVNAKSISHALIQNIPGVSDVTVIGYGDPEMQRDLVLEETSRLRAHVGGCVDVFARLPRGPRTVELTVGASFERPDLGAVVLRDTDSAFSFTAAGVQVGHVLRVQAGLSGTDLSTYLITQVRANEIEVQPRTPFSVATDAYDDTVSYSIGVYGPGYDNVVPLRTTGETSKTITTPNAVVLPGGAVYDITRVTVPSTGAVLSIRVNDDPNLPSAQTTLPLVAATDKYQVVVPRPETSQSTESVALLYVNAAYAGATLRVTYETVSDLPVVQAYVTDPAERTAATNVLARAHHPIYAACSIRYTVRPGFVDPGAAEVKRAVAAFFEQTLDPQVNVGDLIPYLARELPAISGIAPPTITYRLLAPDGQVFSYTTTDVVTPLPSLTNGAVFVGASLLRDAEQRALLADCALEQNTANETAITNANDALARYLASLGVTERTVRVLGDMTNTTASVR